MLLRRLTALVVLLLGILGIIVGILYFADTASSLPSFIPGHVAGLDVHRTHRGIAALVIGAILLAVALLALMLPGRGRTGMAGPPATG